MENSMKYFNITEKAPTKEELYNLWNNMELEKVSNLTQYTQKLIEVINTLYCNGGIKVNKYRIIENNPINYYLFKDRDFVQNIYRNKIILDSREYLKMNGELPKINIKGHFTDIYSLSGDLARIIGYGGAYSNGIEQTEAWKIAIEFVENEFGNRFKDFDFYIVEIENARWFYDVAWDYSFIIKDIRNYEIMFIDITDTD
jgi:hypothetical protein